MARAAYDELAAVYEFLVPGPLLTPEGTSAAFAPVVEAVEPGARLLDCACGTGTLAVGLAQRGFAVTATDASGVMVEQARTLATRHGVELRAERLAWEQLPGRGWEGEFDAVLCVGNSLTHAPGAEGRRAALGAMAGVLRPGGLLAVTSRDWERLLARGPGLDVDERLTERRGRRGLVVRAWTLPGDWEAPHHLDTAVALIGEDGAVRTRGERLTFWPFTHDALQADLRAAGLTPASSTYGDADRYLVTAQAP
jgi:SAM-dependent methyltransferase